MPEPLKLMYNRTFLQNFADKVKSAHPPFENTSFINDVLEGDWQELELKAQMRRISIVLGCYLPTPFTAALDILYRIVLLVNGKEYAEDLLTLLPENEEVIMQSPNKKH